MVSSKLTGANWNGSLTLVDVKSVMEQKPAAAAGGAAGGAAGDGPLQAFALGASSAPANQKGFAQTECGNTDVQWINSELLCVVNDAGQLQLWSAAGLVAPPHTLISVIPVH